MPSGQVFVLFGYVTLSGRTYFLIFCFSSCNHLVFLQCSILCSANHLWNRCFSMAWGKTAYYPLSLSLSCVRLLIFINMFTMTLGRPEILRTMGRPKILLTLGRPEILRTMGRPEMLWTMDRPEILRIMGSSEILWTIGIHYLKYCEQ